MKVYLKWCTLCFFRVILYGNVDFILHNIVLYNVICVLIVRTHIIAIKETVWRYTLNCALFVFFELSCMVRWTSFCTIFYCTMLYLSNTVRTHIIAIKETVWRYTLNCTLFCFFRVILFGKVDFILHNIVLYNVICV